MGVGVGVGVISLVPEINCGRCVVPWSCAPILSLPPAPAPAPAPTLTPSVALDDVDAEPARIPILPPMMRLASSVLDPEPNKHHLAALASASTAPEPRSDARPPLAKQMLWREAQMLPRKAALPSDSNGKGASHRRASTSVLSAPAGRTCGLPPGVTSEATTGLGVGGPMLICWRNRATSTGGMPLLPTGSTDGGWKHMFNLRFSRGMEWLSERLRVGTGRLVEELLILIGMTIQCSRLT